MTLPQSQFDGDEDMPMLNDHEEAALLHPERASQYPPSRPYISSTVSPRMIIALLFAVIFTLEVGGFLMGVPSMRLMEDIICHHYYNKMKGEGHIGLRDKIDESMCKGEEVQDELNIVLAGLNFVGAIPSLVLTVPYGLMMDRIGRKPVFFLSLCGVSMSCCWNIMITRFWTIFPLRLVWMAPIFTIFGGGEAVSAMAVHTIGSDVTSESNRANVFLLGGCVVLLAELIAPTVASALMVKSPWIPNLLGVSIVIVGTILILFIPETLHLHARSAISDPAMPDSDSEQSVELDDSTLFNAVKSQLCDAFRRLRGSFSVLHSLPVLLLMIAFVLPQFNRQSVGLCVRYVSNRFSWTLGNAGYLLSLRALINIIVFFAILPGLSYFFVSRMHFSSRKKDIVLAKLSIVILITGAIIIASSPTVGLTIIGLMIWTLGTGFSSLTRALITTLVDQQHVGRLCAAISIVETSSTLVAGPTLAFFYTMGLRWEGPWVGLPFFLLSAISVIAAVALWGFGFVIEKEGEKKGFFCDDEQENVQSDALLLEPDNAEFGVINVV